MLIPENNPRHIETFNSIFQFQVRRLIVNEKKIQQNQVLRIG